MTTQVQLEIFEGPLDLLLHLIKKNEVSIADIPIATITEQYLATLELMQSLNLDVAGEFLVMAATLIHIKSRMLLPSSEEDDPEAEDEIDSRDELVRRLLEYQRFKDAADQLQRRDVLSRDVFIRTASQPEKVDSVAFGQVSLFELLSALRRVLERLPKDEFHEVTLEKVTVREKMSLLLDALQSNHRVLFESLFAELTARITIIATFLAMLELVKVRAIRIIQEEPTGPIWIEPLAGLDESDAVTAVSG
jgi:segregation and condensation protein A